MEDHDRGERLGRGVRELHLMSDIGTRVHFDGRTIVRERIQDVEPILERNKVLRDMPQPSDWGRHIASIPCVFMEKWLNEEHVRGNVSLRMYTPEFDALIARKLNDPEWKWLRTDGPSAMLGFGS